MQWRIKKRRNTILQLLFKHGVIWSNYFHFLTTVCLQFKMNEVPLAQGFNSILGPAVLEIDKAMVSVQKSQADLGKEIERLVAGTN